MRTIKIAVCLSGQSRYWKLASENIKSFFNYNNVQTDYFIHTWDTNTWRKPKTHHGVFENIKHNDYQLIKDEFNPIFIEQEEFNQEKYLYAWDPMFYSFWKSVMFKREHEITENFIYDVIIKARLDVVYDLNKKINFDNIIPGMCYTSVPINKFSYEFNYNNFDDVIFYGDSKTMDIVSDLYHTYQIKHSQKVRFDLFKSLHTEASLYYGPGCLLYEHMVSCGIHPTTKEILEYAVVRSGVIDANLNSITDFEKIKKIYYNWYLIPGEE
jgi:hypothetical protein